jgi:hypothetical protein
MNEGWLADIRITRQDALMGATTGPTIRPAGIKDSRLQITNHATFARIDPWGQRKGGQTLFWSYKVTIIREFTLDAYADMMLEALSSDTATTATTGGFTTTTRRNKTTPASPASFHLWLKTSDGRTYNATGAVPTKIEWIIQAGRIMIEETEFVVLQLNETVSTPALSFDNPHRITPAAIVYHALVAGEAAWADPEADRVTTFATQLIFVRELDPVQFNSFGQPTRIETKTAWELIGKTQGNLEIVESDLKQGGAARLWWKIKNPADEEEWLTVTAPRAWAKLSSQPLMAKGMIDQFLDWIATSNNTGAFFTESRRRI